MTEEQDHAGGDDALDALADANDTAIDLLERWVAATESLLEQDDVRVRWERGSAVKLLIQHLAVREAAKQAVVASLEDDDNDLADRLQADGVERRKLIRELEELVRGHQAMNLNNRDVDHAVDQIVVHLRGELKRDRDELVPAVRDRLGSAAERSLPSRRRVQMMSSTRPSPTRRWWHRLAPLSAVKALYDSLRTSPRGGTSPAVDSAREHTPGPRD